MSDERQLGRLMSDGMAAQARQVTAGPEFTERIVGRALAGGPSGQPGRRPPGWQNWVLPAVAAALVALLISSALIGTKLLRTSRTPPASSPTASQPAPGPSTGAPSPSGLSTPAPSSSPSSSAGGGEPKGGPVPAGFNGYDLTWVSNDDGWALGTAPCGTPPCTSILRTRDGGKSWVGIPAPRAFLTATDTCTHACDQVSNLRFANPLVGYAYGPNSFYLTTDGGNSWHQQPGYAYGLEVVDGSVLRIAAQAAGCAPGCTFRLQRAAIGSDSWQDVSLPAGGRGASAQLAASGRTVVLATHANVAGGAQDATAVLFTSRDGGSSWQKVGEPCPRRGSDEVDSWNVTVAPDGSITVLCVPRGPLQDGTIFTTTSTDGTRFVAGAPVPGPRPATAVGAVSASHLFVLKDLDGLYRSTDSGAHWTRLADGPPGGNYIGFESSSVGRVIGGQVGAGLDGTWTTTNGGKDWTFHSFG
ncbi:MAG: WD40/YVTN/BNR-like repeat-containing protein [Jatrophihabitantaceae bacterium]